MGWLVGTAIPGDATVDDEGWKTTVQGAFAEATGLICGGVAADDDMTGGALVLGTNKTLFEGVEVFTLVSKTFFPTEVCMKHMFEALFEFGGFIFKTMD